MDIREHEPGTTTRVHVVFRDSGRVSTHHWGDLLPDYGLFHDCRNNVLHDGVTSLSTTGLFAPLSVPSIKVIAGAKALDGFLEEIPGLNMLGWSHREFLEPQISKFAQYTYNL